jgi:type IV pilus assembly protein PilB
MVDMGVPNYLVASSVIGILAQRLVRIVCQKCKHPFTPPQSLLETAGITPEQASKATFMRGKGCGNCQKTGFRGRMGIFELLVINSKIRELVFTNKSSVEIRKTALEQGMHTLYGDGIKKIMRGLTSFEEVLSVAKRTEDD